jgi:hypothetical protein
MKFTYLAESKGEVAPFELKPRLTFERELEEAFEQDEIRARLAREAEDDNSAESAPESDQGDAEHRRGRES